MAIYDVPTVASTTNALGSKTNPIYQSSLTTSYRKSITHSEHSILEYADSVQDFRTLYYALTGQMPKVSAQRQAQYNALDQAYAQSDSSTHSSKSHTATTQELIQALGNYSPHSSLKNS